MKSSKFLALALGAAIFTPAHADVVFDDDVIISKGAATLLCVGRDCVDGEDAAVQTDATLRLKGQLLAIEFVDTSLSSSPDRDWAIQANTATGGDSGEAFFIRDVTSGTRPLYIQGAAPTNAFFIASNGDVGLGTGLPVVDLHMVSTGDSAILRLEETSGTAQAYDLTVNSNFGFYLYDSAAGAFPFILRPGAPTYAIDVNAMGNVGLGTNLPEGKLHTKGLGTQLAYFESSDGGAVQVRFRTDSQNRRFLAVNNANEVKSQIVFGDNQIQFLGQTVAQEWLRISSAGIVSSGPTCNPNPCDATFDPEVFTIPPIEERAAYMWENMHLPAVGPTAPDQPFNVTEKLGGVIHELEVAHIYIGQLHEEQDALKSQIADMAAHKAAQQVLNAELLARLAALESE